MAARRYEISLRVFTKGAIFICNHSNRDLNNMLSPRVKISCLHAKAHVVFYWCLYIFFLFNHVN